MTVEELIEELKKQNPKATVWVDWDREGGNEDEVTRIEHFGCSSLSYDKEAIALR